MKKVIMLISFVFLFTGCSAEYELVYENNVFNESLKVLTIKDENSINEINKYYNQYYIADYKVQLGDMSEFEYITKYGKGYNKELIDENALYGLKLGYSYNEYNEYLNSPIVFSLFENFNISDNFITTNNIKNIFNYYPELKEIKIIFRTDANVLNTNADEIIDDKYYWYINNENYKEKDIFISINKPEKLITEDGYLNGSIIKYILMILLIVILISIVVIYEKVKKSNN